MQKNNLAHHAISGFFWSFLGIATQGLSQILILIILARLLSPEDFGLVGVALIVISFSNIFYELGIGSAIVQRANLEKRHVWVGYTLSLITSVVLSAIVWFSIPLIVSFFRMERLSLILKVMIFIFPVNSLSVVSASLLQKEFKFRTLALVEVISYIVGFGICGIVLATIKFGVWALVCANLCQSVVKAIMLLILERHFLKIFFDLKACKELLQFGIGFSIAEIANFFAGQGDNIITGKVLGAQALGIYGRAYQFMVIPATLFGSVIDKVLFPVMSKIQDKPQQLTQAYQYGLKIIALLTLPLSVVVFILAPEFIFTVLGQKWGAAIIPLQILCISMFFRTSYKLSESLTRASGAVYERAWRQWVYALFVFVGAWVGSRFGISGIAAGVSIAITINFLLMAHLSLKLINMSLRDFIKAHGSSLYLSFLLGVVVFVVKWVCVLLGLQHVLVLILPLFIGLGIELLLCLYWPDIFLGKEGKWLMTALIEKMQFGKNECVKC